MNTPHDTFRRLKRSTLEEVSKAYSQARTGLSPVYSLGSSMYDISHIRNKELMLHHERLRILEEHGWTFDDFVKESEREAILEEIKLLNASIHFPQELIDRAKKFFPNLKITEARIELE